MSRNTTRIASQSGSTLHDGQCHIHRHQQRLVRDRIQHRAERDCAAPPGEPAVDRIRQPGRHEQVEHGGDPVLEDQPERRAARRTAGRT